MGYYIQVPQNTGKAQQIEELYGGMILSKQPDFDKIPESKALICVINNGAFEAAGFAYNESEFKEFARPDVRSRTWLIIDRSIACELTGYKEF